MLGILLTALVAASPPQRHDLAAIWLVYPWVGLGMIFAVLLYFTESSPGNLATSLRYFGWGVLAVFGSFALQSLVNGRLLEQFGEKTLLGILVLGFGSAFCQTLGKWLGIRLLLISMKGASFPMLIPMGLGVGLGFAVGELVVLSLQMIVTGTHPTNLWGMVERGAAMWFHLSSCALLLFGIVKSCRWPVFLVLALHMAMDGFAPWLGSHAPLFLTEALFWFVALLTWAIARAWALSRQAV